MAAGNRASSGGGTSCLRWAVATVVGFLLLGLPTAATAATSAVGSKAGLNWSRLTRPNDAEGEPTLMHGTAFGGIGFTGGLTYSLRFGSAANPAFGLEIDLLYSLHRASGFEENKKTGARRTAVLSAQVLRVPALAILQFGAPDALFAGYFGLGPELWAGLEAGASVELEGAPGPPEPLNTTPVAHGTLNAVAGTKIRASREFAVPVEVRVVWDPFVGDSTVERFDGFSSSDNPGNYEVAFDWQVLVMTGISWSGL